MRADAQRNAQKLRTAAAELFHERGLQVPLKEIARRAGVSHGTLYNIFGTREALIDDVVADLAAARLDQIAQEALAHDDGWDGFAFYVEKVCELQASDQALNDVIIRRFPGTDRLLAICEGTQAASTRIIERAQQDGTLRPDFTGADLLFIFATNAPLARASVDAAPDAWRRGVAFILDGLRTEAAHPLPAEPLTAGQALQVMIRIPGTP